MLSQWPTTIGSGLQEWKNGWTVVLAAAAGTSLGSLSTYPTGLFINPLEQEFGWSRAGISGAVTIFAAVGVVGATAAGYCLDRIGARRMALTVRASSASSWPAWFQAC
ncbi:hypothetical protein BH10PSE13_BH10PSE13_13120 [soil metagenome]